MQKFAFALIVLCLLVLAGFWFYQRNQVAPEPPPERDDTTLRSTTAGDVVGFVDELGARAWLGIPYAAPPVDARRWRAPEPHPGWDGVREALAIGSVCPQFQSPLSGAGLDANTTVMVGDEDCLYLNVWAPPNAVKRPVMVWVHGGGNTIGHGGNYRSARLATAGNVVVVTINYRLGVFGWFTHSALHTGDPNDDSGNYGTLDIVQALAWTRDNVARFGGDPDNVTVFGESAGGYNTLSMMATPLARGLFHRAIVQSGGYEAASPSEGANFIEDGGASLSSREIVNQLLVARGDATDRDAARAAQQSMSDADVRTLLYDTTAEELFALFSGSAGFGMINLPGAFADGHVLPDRSPEATFSTLEHHNAVPIVLGTNRDEPAIFMVRDPEWVNTYLGIFARLKDPAAYRRAVYYGAKSWKLRGVDELARWMTAAGNPDVFAYRFDWDEEPSVLGYDLSVALGAAHGLEIPFVFGSFDSGFGIGYLYEASEGAPDLMRSIMSYWTRFAADGDPHKGLQGDQPHWQRWGRDTTQLMLDTQADGGIRMDANEVTYRELIAELSSDPDIADQRERCQLYVRSFDRDQFDPAIYADLGSELGGRGCSEWDPETFRSF